MTKRINLFLMPKLSLLAKFTIISFLITAAIAIALGWGIQQQMEQNALSQATENTADHVSTILNQRSCTRRISKVLLTLPDMNRLIH
jgi:hypothetical protein